MKETNMVWKYDEYAPVTPKLTLIHSAVSIEKVFFFQIDDRRLRMLCSGTTQS